MIGSRRVRIQDAPHGVNVVVETRGVRVYIGRYDSASAFTALLHDCDVHDFGPGEDRERYIREAATYGIDVRQRDVSVEVAQVTRVRLLGEIEKLA